jgi:hypothetical protein
MLSFTIAAGGCAIHVVRARRSRQTECLRRRQRARAMQEESRAGGFVGPREGTLANVARMHRASPLACLVIAAAAAVLVLAACSPAQSPSNDIPSLAATCAHKAALGRVVDRVGARFADLVRLLAPTASDVAHSRVKKNNRSIPPPVR